MRRGGQDLVIALNISGRLLADQVFQARVLDMVGTSGATLCFEITETAVIQQPGLAKQALAAFRKNLPVVRSTLDHRSAIGAFALAKRAMLNGILLQHLLEE